MAAGKEAAPARPRVNLVSLGCSKNLVDSEVVLRRLEASGLDVTADARTAPRGATVIVNTCGFIGDAKEESVNEILHWARQRREGRIGKLIVMGCLSERYRSELPPEIPEVDHWRGKSDWADVVGLVTRERQGVLPYDRLVTTPRHHAYLKVAEGCNRFCAFCAIPLITGRFRSRPVAELVDEARLLASRGVKELNVIAQELSSYGSDLAGGRPQLPELVERLADVEGIEWIRLHYAYPAGFPLEVLDVMRERPNVCRYIDIALQHIANPVLTNMRRHIDADTTRALLAEMRSRVPGLHIRTTLMTGFPGEGPDEFEQLMAFVAEQRFERMGAFAYCEEEGTWGARHLPDTVPPEVKQERLERLMALQESISDELQQQKVGRTMKVVIDRAEGDNWVGRTEFDSPEVDPEVLVSRSLHPGLRRGRFYDMLITEAYPFELVGQPVSRQ